MHKGTKKGNHSKASHLSGSDFDPDVSESPKEDGFQDGNEYQTTNFYKEKPEKKPKKKKGQKTKKTEEEKENENRETVKQSWTKYFNISRKGNRELYAVDLLTEAVEANKEKFDEDLKESEVTMKAFNQTHVNSLPMYISLHKNVLETNK